jgi:hypothetical protein
VLQIFVVPYCNIPISAVFTATINQLTGFHANKSEKTLYFKSGAYLGIFWVEKTLYNSAMLYGFLVVFCSPLIEAKLNREIMKSLHETASSAVVEQFYILLSM